MRFPFVRFAPAAALAVAVTLGAARPAAADLDVEVQNANKVVGTILPVSEIEVFRAFIPTGAKITAAATGKRVKKTAPPPMRMTMFDPDEIDVEDAAILETRTGAKLLPYRAEFAGTYGFRLSSIRSGDYTFSVKWKSPSGTHKSPYEFAFTGDTYDEPISADAGATLSLTIAAAKGSASRPRITFIESADGEWLSDFFEPPSETASVHRVPRVRLGGRGGDYIVHTEESGEEGGAAVLTVTIKPPRAVARRVDVSKKTTGSDDTNQFGKGAVIGVDGGDLGLSTDLGSPIDGAGLSVPPGALDRNVVIVISTGTPVTPPGDVQAQGAAVNFGPDGLKFKEAAGATLVTLPFDPTEYEGDFSTLDIYVRDAQGKVALVTPKSAYEIDPIARTVSFPVSHFSTYQVFGRRKPRKRDLNGDGIDDLIVPAPAAGGDRGRVHVFFGKKGFAPTSTAQADATFQGAAPGNRFGVAVAAGDVNGDGVADLVVGSPGAAGGGRVDVFPGGKGFSSDTSPLTFSGGASSGAFGTAVLCAEVTGDSLGDLVVGDPLADGDELPDEGAAYVFRGRLSFASGSAESADFTLTGGTPELLLGTALAAGRLIDGTEQTLVISSSYGPAGFGSGTVHVVPAGAALASGIAFDVGAEYSGDAPGDEFGAEVAVGDVNGDGIPDLVAGAPGASPFSFDDSANVPQAGSVFIFFGPDFDGGGAAIADLETYVFPKTGQERGRALALGNFIGDSFPDLVVGLPGHDEGTRTRGGQVTLQRGGEAFGLGFEVDYGASADDRLGARFLPVADVNGDGRDDIAVSAPGANGGAGQVIVHFGPGLLGPRRTTIAGEAGESLGSR